MKTTTIATILLIACALFGCAAKRPVSLPIATQTQVTVTTQEGMKVDAQATQAVRESDYAYHRYQIAEMLHTKCAALLSSDLRQLVDDTLCRDAARIADQLWREYKRAQARESGTKTYVCPDDSWLLDSDPSPTCYKYVVIGDATDPDSWSTLRSHLPERPRCSAVPAINNLTRRDLAICEVPASEDK